MPFHSFDEHALDRYFDSIRHIPLLTADQEKELGRQWRDQKNPDAVKRLVESNLRYVVKEARKFEGLGLDLLDLISEGNLGLIEAAKRFDPERGTKFLTYASWWVRQAIFHALAQHGSRIRIPQKLASSLLQFNRLEQTLRQRLGRAPTSAELAEHSRFSEEEVERFQVLLQTTTTVSMEQWMGDSEYTIGESLEQAVEPSAASIMDQEAFHQVIESTLKALPERERKVLSMHFGIGQQNPMTLEEIGKQFHPPISRERVRQLEERAFHHIRQQRKELLRHFLHGDSE